MATNLSKNLKVLRKKTGLTQEGMANLLRVKRGLIGAYEEGRSCPRPEVLAEITARFNVTLHALISDDLSYENIGGAIGASKELCKSPTRISKVIPMPLENYVETRATFIVREDLLDKLKAIAFWEGSLNKDQLNAALDAYIKDYEKAKGKVLIPTSKAS